MSKNSKKTLIGQMFGVSPELYSDYVKMTNIGKEYLSNIGIGIVGLCRNNSAKINNFFNIAHYLSSQAKQTQIFIYENDSTDDTVAQLEKFGSYHDNFAFISDTLNRKQYGQVKDLERTQNLAEYRNKCLDYIRNNFSDNIEYIIVMDTDLLEISIEGFFNSFGWLKTNKDIISAICGFSYTFNKSRGMLWNYDSWAFRWTWWEDQLQYSHHLNYNPSMWFGFWCPYIGSSPIAVNSGFGGYCIYRKKDLLKTRYEGNDCEHVCLHKNLKKTIPNFQLYANPSQITLLDIISDKPTT